MTSPTRLGQKGMSLVEVMITVGVIGILATFVLGVLQLQGTQIASSFSKYSDDGDLDVVARQLNSSFAAMNLRLYGFMGDGSGQTAIMRVPLKDACSDINQTCANNTAFLFATVRKSSQAVPAICILNEPDRISLIIDVTDVGDQTYQIAGNEIVLQNSGNVVSRTRFPVGGFATTLAEQYGLLLRVSQAPVLYDPGFDAATGGYGQTAFANNGDCVNNAISNGAAGRYARLEVEPFLLPRTGSAVPTRADVAFALGKFPVRVGEGVVLSMGKTSGGDSAALVECSGTGAGPNCNTPNLTIPNVAQIGFKGFLRVPFAESNALVSFGLQNWGCIVSDGCVTMAVANTIPYKLAGEAVNSPSNTAFTMIKQEQLSSLIIHIATLRKSSSGQNVQGRKKIYVNLI